MLNLASTMKTQPRREARVVVVGGGVAGGAFASELLALVGEAGAAKGGKALCVVLSSYPEGVAPYDRTALSKEALDLERLTKHGARPEAFPWTKGVDGARMGPEWFAATPGVYGNNLVSLDTFTHWWAN